MTTKKKKNPHHGSTLDSFLKEEDVLEQFVRPPSKR